MLLHRPLLKLKEGALSPSHRAPSSSLHEVPPPLTRKQMPRSRYAHVSKGRWVLRSGFLVVGRSPHWAGLNPGCWNGPPADLVRCRFFVDLLSTMLLIYDVGSFLSDGVRWQLTMPVVEPGHDRDICNSQPLDATDPQLLIQHGHGILGLSHLASPSSVITGGSILSHDFYPVVTSSGRFIWQVCEQVRTHFSWRRAIEILWSQ